MTIKQKLNLITAIVISFALIIIAIALVRAVEEKETITKSQNLNVLSHKLSLFIHEIQKERGASAGFIGSGGKQFKDILQSQRTKTTKEYENLSSYIKGVNISSFDREIQVNISTLETQVSNMGEIRGKVDSLSISSTDVVTYYTNLNNTILNIVSLTAKAATTQELVKALSAYTNFLKSKERSGIERATLSATFAANKFGDGVYAKWLRLVAEQDTFMEVFLSLSNDTVKSLYAKEIDNPVIAQVNSMRDIANKKYKAVILG